MSKITGNVVGLPNPLSKVRAEIEKPREVIKFNNGIRLEAREDGVYVVTEIDGEIYEQILVTTDGDIESYYAEEAQFAYQAMYDVNDNEITGHYATKEEVGEISAVLDELHTYAQTLIDGGASE